MVNAVISRSRSWQRLRHSVVLWWALANYSIQGRYKRTIFGPLWAIFTPVFEMIVFTMLGEILTINTDGIPYPIFVYSVIVPWSYFTGAVGSAGGSIISNRALLKKMDLPKEVFLLTAIGISIFDLIMKCFVMVGLMIWFKVPVNWTLLWIFPLLTMLTVMAFGWGLLIASFGTYRSDVMTINGYIFRALQYISPIIYPLSTVPKEWQTLYKLNPFVGILEGFRSVLTQGQAPDASLLLLSIPGIVLLLLVAWPIFGRMSRYFADAL